MLLAIAININDSVLVAIIAVAAGLIAINLFQVTGLFRAFLQATLSGVKVSFIELVGMRFRRSDVPTIIGSAIALQQAGCPVPLNRIETHSLARGDVNKVAAAVIAAKNTGVPLTWDQACEIDLGGQDVLEHVLTRAKKPNA